MGRISWMLVLIFSCTTKDFKPAEQNHDSSNIDVERNEQPEVTNNSIGDLTPKYPPLGGGKKPRKENLCGNNVVDPKEDCDDGNRIDFDGCSKHCKFEAGFPVCAFECITPECGALICDPVCEPPKCRTTCEPLPEVPFCTCDQKCEKPECEIRCEDSCEAGDCPECVTVCKQPHCVVHCQAEPGKTCQAPAPDCKATCDEASCGCKCRYPDCEPACGLQCN